MVQHKIMDQTLQQHPLRWVLLPWVGVMYLQGLLEGNTGPRLPTGGGIWIGIDPALFAIGAFTALMAVHSTLHGIALFRMIRPRLLLPYFLGQGVLMLLMLYLADEQSAVLGLCLVLTLEAIHLLKSPGVLMLVVGLCLIWYILALNPLQFYLAPNLSVLSHKLVSSLTTILFVVACALLYYQRAQAHQRDQELLRELEVAHAHLAQTHEQLETAHIQLEDDAAQIEALTLTTERQRLARDLHDTLAQGLVGLTMQLETANGLLTQERSGQAQQVVQQAMIRARATLADARGAIDDLRTQATDEQPFTGAAEEMLCRFTSATGIPYHARLEAGASLPRSFHEHALRVISEGVTNVARHARACQVWVSLTQELDGYRLEVRDDGVGFDLAAAPTHTGHYGLLGLRERARLLGGTLELRSTPGEGTTLRLLFPTGTEQDEQERQRAGHTETARAKRAVAYDE
jgi:NarL family two-component system sensor histidine kinase YdfH